MNDTDTDTLAIGFLSAKSAATKIEAGRILAEIMKLMAVMSATEIENAKILAEATLATQEEDCDGR